VAGRSIGPHVMAPPPDPMFAFRHILRELPDERRAEVDSELRRHIKGLAPEFRGMHHSQEKVRGALSAQPFDPEALDTALGAFRSHLMETQERSHRALGELAAALTPEERKALAASLDRHPGKRQNGRRPGRPSYGFRPTRPPSAPSP
ncbi:MAG: periplasmic heavy metal sensor, partial [Pseudomonadales bacterium]|nr:periplasmic heavy metal sensor [Pseudomonadales bacterium]